MRPVTMSVLLITVLACIPLLLADAASLSHDFSHLLGLSYRFYEAQMSGDIPTWSRASQAQGGWRNRSHTGDGSGPGGIGVDLTGGWYDSGDHLKLGLPLGASVSLLSYGMLTWERSYRDAGQWDVAVRNIEWAASYLVKCHVNVSDVPADNAFVAQVSDGHTEHELHWGRPEQQPEGGAEGSVGWRPVYVIRAPAEGEEAVGGADVVAQAAAALASTSLLLRRSGSLFNPDRAEQLLTHAQQLYSLAQLLHGTWSPPNGSQVMYGTSRWQDDMAWAAAWLCRTEVETASAAAAAAAAAVNTTTADGVAAAAAAAAAATATSSSFCVEAASAWSTAAGTDEYGRDDVSWAGMFPLASLLLRGLGAGGSSMVPRYQAHVDYVMNRWLGATGQPCTSNTSGHSVCYTPGGLAWYSDEGSARYAANIAHLALAASTPAADAAPGPGAVTALRRQQLAEAGAAARQRRCWAWRQVSYLLGENPSNQSYVVGYRPSSAHTSPTQPTHKSSSCSPDFSVTCDLAALTAPGPNPSELTGALVGGPDRTDFYNDSRTAFEQNQVALDYNAGFTGALAALAAATADLAAAGCDWEGYCAGSCSPGGQEEAAAAASCPVEAPPGGFVCTAAPPEAPPGMPPSPQPPSPRPPSPRPPPPSPQPSAPSPRFIATNLPPTSPSPPVSGPSPPRAPPLPPAPPISLSNLTAPCPEGDAICSRCSDSRVVNVTACRYCVALMRAFPGLGNPLACHECVRHGATDGAVQDVCFTECVPATMTRGASWACASICTAPINVGNDVALVRQCGRCVTGTDHPGACNECIQLTRCAPDTPTARSQCLDCVADDVIGPRACLDCAQLSTYEGRAGCMGCYRDKVAPLQLQQIMSTSMATGATGAGAAAGGESSASASSHHRHRHTSL